MNAVEDAAVEALAAVIRTERLLATKRRAYEGLTLEAAKESGGRVSPEWVEVTQRMMDAAVERAAKEGLTRWMP